MVVIHIILKILASLFFNPIENSIRIDGDNIENMSNKSYNKTNLHQLKLSYKNWPKMEMCNINIIDLFWKYFIPDIQLEFYYAI